MGDGAPRAQAQLVWKSAEWNLGDFRKLVENPARIKQVYDVARIGDGKFLNNIKNSLNGLRFGFGIPEQQIKVAAALHGPANMINYDDYIWDKYQVGKWLAVADPATGKPAVRNIFFPAKSQSANAGVPEDPDDPKSLYQDSSVQTLEKRGVRFLSCHTATEEQARALIQRSHLMQTPEEIVQDMLGHVCLACSSWPPWWPPSRCSRPRAASLTLPYNPKGADECDSIASYRRSSFFRLRRGIRTDHAALEQWSERSRRAHRIQLSRRRHG